MMKAKNNFKKILPSEHLEHYVKNTTALERLNWLEQARHFVAYCQSKKTVRKTLGKGAVK